MELLLMKIRCMGLLLLSLGLIASACGGDHDSSGAATASSDEADTPAFQTVDDAATDDSAVDAVIDDALGALLEFENREIQRIDAVGEVEWALTVGVPVRWVLGAPDGGFPGLFRETLDRLTPQFWISVSCGGFCNERSAADWPTQIFEGDYEQYRDPERFTLRRDETLPDGVLLLAESRSADRTTLAIGRWNDGGERFFSCLYQTEEPVDLVIAQFEAACTLAELGGLP
jgi:hypothetical protein